MKKKETNEILERIMLVALAALFCFIVGFQITFAEIYKRTDEKETIPFAENCRTAFEEYSQNPSTEWERLTNPTFPLGVINWDLVTNQSASDKSMDKMIVGTVKNNSEENFLRSRLNLLFMVRKEIR